MNVDIIGNPREAKYGMPLDDMIAAYKQLKEAGVTRFGIHTMLLSNELDWRNHEEIADALFGAATAIAHEVGINFEFINLGGGIGVPYRPTEHEFDLRGFAIALKNSMMHMIWSALVVRVLLWRMVVTLRPIAVISLRQLPISNGHIKYMSGWTQV